VVLSQPRGVATYHGAAVTLLRRDLAAWEGQPRDRRARRLARATRGVVAWLRATAAELEIPVSDDQAATTVGFRRLFIERGALGVEVAPGECYWLPGSYDARAVLRRVRAAGRVDLKLWVKLAPSV
jgi:hypothetical protein